MSDKILKQLILGDDLADQFGNFDLGNLGFSLADFDAGEDQYIKKKKLENKEEKKEEHIKYMNKKHRLGKKKPNVSKDISNDEKTNEGIIQENGTNVAELTKKIINKKGGSNSDNHNLEFERKNRIPQEKDLDLKVICVHDGEKIYKLSDLFVPKDEKLVKKIERYNYKYMSISEKEKYDKENEGQKKDMSETDEIKQIIKKAKRNQKFTKINITYDEKFFDRTHFLENIHASTLAHQEIVLMENKEQIKKQILQEGLLKSYGILPEKKMNNNLIERNLLNSLFFIKVKLDENEKRDVEYEDDIGDIVNYSIDFTSDKNFINPDEKNLVKIKNFNDEYKNNFYNENSIFNMENLENSNLSKDNSKNIPTNGYEKYNQQISKQNCIKKGLIIQKINKLDFSLTKDFTNDIKPDPNEFDEVIKIKSESKSSENEDKIKNNPNTYDDVELMKINQNNFTKMLEKMGINAETPRSLLNNQYNRIEEEEIFKLNSLIQENVEKNLKINPIDLKNDKTLQETYGKIKKIAHKEPQIITNVNNQINLNNGNNFNSNYFDDYNKENSENEDDVNGNHLMDLDQMDQSNNFGGSEMKMNMNREMEFDNLNRFSFKKKKLDFKGNLNETEFIQESKESLKFKNTERKSEDLEFNDKIKEFQSDVINEEKKNKKGTIRKKSKTNNEDDDYDNSENNQEFDNYEEENENEENEEEDEESDNQEFPVLDIFETKEFKLFNLQNSQLLKKAVEENEKKENEENMEQNGFNLIISTNKNVYSDKQNGDFKFSKPLPNLAKEKNFLSEKSNIFQTEALKPSNLNSENILGNYQNEFNFLNTHNIGNISELKGLDIKKPSNCKSVNENNIIKIEKKEFLGLKKERDLADNYDLYNKSKCEKNKQQGYYNESLLTGDYISAVLLSEQDISSQKHKFFEVSKKIFDINDFNMNFELLKLDQSQLNKKDKEKEGKEIKENNNKDNQILSNTIVLSNSPKKDNCIQDIDGNGDLIANLPLNEEPIKQNVQISSSMTKEINVCSPEDFFTNLSLKINGGGSVNQNQNFLKIGKAKGNLLTHAKCSYNLTYNKINLTYDDLRDFHRPNFSKFLLREKKKKNFSFSISDKYNLSKGDKIKRWDAAILTRSFLKKQEKKRISKNIQYMNAYEIFKDRYKLSLNDGKYALFEHIDEYPLFLSNFGMASKLKKFLYSNKLSNINVSNPNSKLTDVELKTYNITGPYGSQIILQQNQRLPLVGQIDNNELKGISVTDNKMYRAPVFYEKVKNPVIVDIKKKKVNKENDNNEIDKYNIHKNTSNNQTNHSTNTHIHNHSVTHTRKRNILSLSMKNNHISNQYQGDINNTNNNTISTNLGNFNNTLMDPNNIQIVEKDGKKYYNFLLTFRKSKEGKESYMIRELEHGYIVAQEEPKIEVYPPQSRQYNNFIKKKIQTYTYKLYDEIGYKRGINFKEFTNLFPHVTEQILKKNFREMNIDIDKNICFFSKIPSEDNHMLITPENICQFESCQFGIYKLREVGIKNLTNPDKISYATNKFINQTSDQKQQFLAKVTEEELLTTPWNITQNFLQAKQIKGMLAIKGIGDPSNGQGGYSFLKMPVKTYNDNKTLKEEIDILKNANKNIKTVTGTDADLRKLSKEDIKMKLIQLGQDEEIINKLSRWERVSLLRYRSSQAAQMGYEGDITKYARGTRMNSKVQRDTYQKNINEVFKKQINYIVGDNQDNYISESDESDYGDLFGNINQNQIIDLDEEDPKKGLNFMKNEIYSNPNNKKKKRPDSKRIGMTNEQAIKRQNDEKIIKLYKKSNEEAPHGDGNMKIKFDMKNIDIQLLQRKKKSTSHLGDIYEYEMDKTSNLMSRKRRDTPEKSFNDIIEDIVDNCIKFDSTKIFHQPVKKKDYKDYYELIKNPIDLSAMKNKTKRCEYKNLHQFLDDLDLMVENSKTYNGEEHEVTLQGLQIKEYAIKKIEEKKDIINEMENKLNPRDD